MKKKYSSPETGINDLQFPTICGTIASGETYDGISDIDAKERDDSMNEEREERPDWDGGLW